MSTNLLFILLIVAAGLGATFAFEPQDDAHAQAVLVETRAATEPETVVGLSQEQDGIEVTIEKIDSKITARRSS